MHKIIVWGLSVLCLCACADTSAGIGRAAVNRADVASYLDTLGLNTPGVADNVTYALNNGEKYRNEIFDRSGKKTMLTAWIEQQAQNTLCMTYYRDERCSECNGSGKRAAPKIIGSKAAIAFACRKCKGEGLLRHQFHRRCWVLASEEFSRAAGAGENRDAHALKDAPEHTAEYAAMVSSDDPRERLNACLWLDRNYIRNGQHFQQLTPILERAHYIGREDRSGKLSAKVFGVRLGESGVTVYQFLAGKGLAEENDRAYYRIYIDNRSGKVKRTAFVAEVARRR